MRIPDCSDHLGCLHDPAIGDNVRELTNAALNQFVESRYRVSLGSLRSESDLPARLARHLADNGRFVEEIEARPCPVAKLPNSWDGFLQKLSSNFRSQVRRHYKRATNDDSVQLLSLDASNATAFVDKLIELNQERMTAKGQISSMQDEAFQAFLKQAVPYMVGQRLAWLDCLKIDGLIAGLALNLVHGNTVYYYQGGFANSASRYRPGTVLFAHVISRAIQHGYRRYDFLRGAETYKYRWGARDEHDTHIVIHPGGEFTGRLSAAADRVEHKWKRLRMRFPWR